jgi:hypothetical protein
VQIDLSGSFQTTLTIQNNANSASNGRAWTEVQLSAEDAGSYLNAPELDLMSSPAFTYTGLAPGASITSPLLTMAGTDSETYTLQAVLDEFTGNGSISLSASTYTDTVLANHGGNTYASQVTLAGLTGDVIYTYNAVPEPGTCILLGLGAAGMLFFARHRRGRQGGDFLAR